jgi:hypothetical protein
MATLIVPAGTSRSWTLRLRNADGQALTDTYAGTEPLTLQIWAGDDQEVQTLAASEATWQTAALGLVTVLVHEADTTTLTPSVYRLRVLLTDTGQTFVVAEATLEITASPGTADAPPVYCTVDDVRRAAPWIDEMVGGGPEHQSDLAEARALARQWIDRTAISRARRILESQYEAHAPLSSAAATDPTTGVDAGPAWGPSIYPQVDVAAQLTLIQGYLADEGLELDSTVVRAAALWTVAELCDQQLDAAGDTEPNYRTMGDRCRVKALYLLAGHTLRVDADDDQTYDLVLAP